ncbi:ATP-binding protein [Spongisporangium articulatum]|uniref:Sensor-like histidine kinase SenX3 n=1 Tax=Spongisporangium articulatum TaxID=3362603 RepID=A0ABW8ATW4_9ACTN
MGDARLDPRVRHGLPDARMGPEQLLALLDHTSAVVYVRDLEGRYVLVNREYERLFGVRREELLGLTDHDLFPRQVADAFRENDLQAILGGRPVTMEEVAPGEDGSLHTYVTVKFPLLDAAGKAYMICGISTDITDRKRAEDEVRLLNAELEQRVEERTAELAASTQELDAFAYSVSHDLRAPLRALHGYSQVLLEDYAGDLDETATGYLERLQANATKMDTLIESLLRLSRTTRAELHRQPVDLAELATSIVADLRAAEPGREVSLVVDGPLSATGDVHLLRAALHNLLANAWKFTARSDSAQIKVGWVAQTGRPASLAGPPGPAFVVADNGAGFDPRFAAKLFQPFQRLHHQEDFDGSGIGLAIVKRIIRRHGGDIWAESAPGEGATFYFTLPRGA